MERNESKEQREIRRAEWRAYYNTNLRYKLYAAVAFALGAVAMDVSMTTALLVFIALFIIPGLLGRR